MKRILELMFVAFVIFLTVTGCGKASAPTVTEKIEKHYNTIVDSNNSSMIRAELEELEKLLRDTNISQEERMFAQYTYNVSYGMTKLFLSGKSISAFDFPEVEFLSGTVGAIAKNELEITDVMVSESEKFVQKVEKFLQ